MANLNRFCQPLWDLDTFYVFNDFSDTQSDLNAVKTVTDSGTAATGTTTTRGVMVLTPSDGTVADNDEVYLATPNALWVYAAGRPIYGRCRLQFAETAAGVFNCAFGFQSAVAANSIVDDGGGLRTTGSCVAIYKVDGEQVWRCVARNGSTVTITQSTKSSTNTAFQVLEVSCGDNDGVTMTVTYKVDGDYLRDSNNLIIRHSVPVSGATAMQMWAGAKLGAITNNDTLSLDYWYGAQLR